MAQLHSLKQGTRRKHRSPARTRLSPGDRRQQLLDAASTILSRHGVDRVQISEVAQAAGVTRPVVYKFFPHRQALIAAMLEDFESELSRRFLHAFMTSVVPGDMDTTTSAFIGAVCDTIEVKGNGPWRLLDSQGPDREVARLARKILHRLLDPWLERIAQATGCSPREAVLVARMLVAAGRAALELWFEGVLSRQDAIAGTIRGVSALLKEFSRPSAS
jgi:AcrR family transcriptional regulator